MWPVVLLAFALLAPAPAFGWQQTMTCLLDDPPAPTATPFCTGGELPKPFRWDRVEIPYAVNERVTPQMLEAIRASFDTWNDVECSDFYFVYDGLTPADAFDREDGINLVTFHDEGWPYGDQALAITTVTTTPAGLITNTDLELNADTHEFTIVEGDSVAWDVQNTVTHEAGHMLGLDHSDVPDSTMEFDAQRGETKKRDLHEDDIEGLCTIYPIVEEMDPVEAPDDGCCAVSAPPRTGSLALLFVAAVWLRGRLRRR